MDRRIGYALGDLVANLVVGMLVAVACWLIVSPGWNHFAAMFAMMVVGMVLGMIAFLPISIKLGAMEAMVPLMFTGMVAGMMIGMAEAMMQHTLAQALIIGAVAGGGNILFIWIANSLLRGITREGEGQGDA